MNHGDTIDKITLLDAIGHIDDRHPSEFTISQAEQLDRPDSNWTIRYNYDSGNASGRLLTDQQLRLLILKALAYDELLATMETIK